MAQVNHKIGAGSIGRNRGCCHLLAGISVPSSGKDVSGEIIFILSNLRDERSQAEGSGRSV